MTSKSTASRLLTPADLAERWTCATETVMQKVRSKNVPFVWLGPGDPKLGTAGQKFIRFRLEEIERWEAAQVYTAQDLAGREEPATKPMAGWDGLDRLKGRRQRKPNKPK